MATRHVRQRGRSDCGVAAIAMLTGRSYEEVYAAARRANGGDAFHPRRGMSGTSHVLEALGYHWENLGRHKDHPAPNPDGPQFRTLHIGFQRGIIDPRFYRQFVWGRRALLSIESLNNPGGRHLVFYDGERIWDPQDGRRGKKFVRTIDEATIEEMYILRETP